MPEADNAAAPAAATPTDAAQNVEATNTQDPALKPEPNEKDPNFMAKRFAALTRQERQLNKEKQAQKERIAELEAKAAKADEYDNLLKAAKEDPNLLLEKAGLTFDELAQIMLSQATTPKEVLEVRKELKRVEARIDQEKEEAKEKEELKQLEADKAKIDSAIEEYKTATVEFLNENSETYELILVHNALDDVYAVAERMFDETGEVPSIKEAADAVESDLLEQAENALKAKKISSRFSPKEPLKETAKRDVQEIKKPSLTLRNGPASAPPVVASNSPTSSSQERLNRAVGRLVSLTDR